MGSFHVRLHIERERLLLTKKAFAGVGGVSLRTQASYERGERPPDINYIMDLQKIGVDICFLLTGIRASDGNTEADTIYTAYKRSNAGVQECVAKLLDINLVSVSKELKISIPLASESAISEQIIHNHAEIKQIFTKE